MIALLQRVTQASVTVTDECIGQIGRGLLVLVCAEREDTPALANKLLDRVVRYRVFSDEKGRMNRSLSDLHNELGSDESADAVRQTAGLLLVPQFTLAADTRSGLRPSFTPAAPPEQGSALFDHFVDFARQRFRGVQTGQFGADMQVGLTNDGPVTFWLQVKP